VGKQLAVPDPKTPFGIREDLAKPDWKQIRQK
jgi:hypothetical protein